MKERLSINEAYLAAFCFLEDLYFLTKSDDLGGFVGSMQLSEDGRPFDSALTNDWRDAVNKSVKQENLSIGEAYLAMFYFLEDFSNRINSNEIGVLLSTMQLDKNDIPLDATIWDDWLKAVYKSIKKK